MRALPWLLLPLLFCCSLRVCATAEPEESPESKEIRKLVEQLGAETFRERTEASIALEKRGEKAIVALVEAAATSKDRDIKRAAERLVRKLMPATIESKTTEMKLASVPAGNFDMGSPGKEPYRRDDETLHAVRITRPFYLGVTEVTQGQYEKVMKTNPAWFNEMAEGKDRVKGVKTENLPVERVSWYDALEYCNRLSKADGLPEHYEIKVTKKVGGSIVSATVAVKGGRGYRLPTEAEWEYACRAGTMSAMHFGLTANAGDGNMKSILISGGYGGNYEKWRHLDRTDRAGAYKQNKFGLFDMHGSVGEWCFDVYDRGYYAVSPKDDPKGPEKGTHRVVRGGSWILSETACRRHSRTMYTPDDTTYQVGFRVARNP